MSRFSSAVTLVTTDGRAGRRGTTVTSACSVSDDPATLLVCLNSSSRWNDRFELNGNFAVNILAHEDERLARAFAGQGDLDADARFALGQWEKGKTGAPLLRTALAAFDCKLVEGRLVATHRVLIGEAISLHVSGKRPPLLYFDRTYHSV